MTDQIVIPARPGAAPPPHRRVDQAIHPVVRNEADRSQAPGGGSSTGVDLDAVASGVLAAVDAMFAGASRPMAAIAIVEETERAAGSISVDELRAKRVAALGHELRETLALISGYSQSLLHLGLDEESRRHYLMQIPIAAGSLADLADEILDLAAEARASEPQPAAQLLPDRPLEARPAEGRASGVGPGIGETSQATGSERDRHRHPQPVALRSLHAQ